MRYKNADINKNINYQEHDNEKDNLVSAKCWYK